MKKLLVRAPDYPSNARLPLGRGGLRPRGLNLKIRVCTLSLLSTVEETYKKYIYEPHSRPVSSVGLWTGPPKSMGSIHHNFRNRPAGIVAHTVSSNKIIWGYFEVIFPRGSTAPA